ncbi:hypothetical protein C2869_14265 [Saccharobesus litoralis]|uniref:FlgO domain-containing protein n=1 Tax=Saccharobesus litoralis TaxID=2172099 RepID=A0A2S0VTM5_9ALTE|nr:FlgO family outer membrane protein [Saccharobesus litoralis]AWB67532.1 hypothetical protein C2869_14265 [Saccharobesus litoralis]
MTRLIKCWFVTGVAAILSACTFTNTHSYQMPKPPEHSAENYYAAPISELSVKAYTYMLADELLLNLSANKLAGKILVTNFVDQKTRLNNPESGHPLASLGGQLEEGFVYELTKRGFAVVDHKLMEQVKVNEQGDKIWSRNKSELKSRVDARYILSGTLTEHERGAVVNVKLIKFSEQQVVSAAQGFVPSNVFWTEDNIGLRDGFLHHKGERRRTY